MVAVAHVDASDQYVLRANQKPTTSTTLANVTTYPQGGQWENLWHRRTGHLAVGRLSTMSKVVNGVGGPAAGDVQQAGAICQPCVEARMQSAPFNSTAKTTSRSLEMLHVDLVGPLPPSRGGARHFVAIGDCHTELMVGTSLKTKGEAGV